MPPLFGDSWSASVGEALPRLNGALGGMDASYSSWSDPTIDDYLAQIGQTFDNDARAELYKALQAYMVELFADLGLTERFPFKQAVA